jgi:hypothetical protein
MGKRSFGCNSARTRTNRAPWRSDGPAGSGTRYRLTTGSGTSAGAAPGPAAGSDPTGAAGASPTPRISGRTATATALASATTTSATARSHGAPPVAATSPTAMIGAGPASAAPARRRLPPAARRGPAAQRWRGPPSRRRLPRGRGLRGRGAGSRPRRPLNRPVPAVAVGHDEHSRFELGEASGAAAHAVPRAARHHSLAHPTRSGALASRGGRAASKLSLSDHGGEPAG